MAKCLVNTDFYVVRGVVIKKDQDSIVMENPGYVRTGKRQMLKGGISDPRNKALMKMFNMIGIGERAGSGVPDIFSVWEQEGWNDSKQIFASKYMTVLPTEEELAYELEKNQSMFISNISQTNE